MSGRQAAAVPIALGDPRPGQVVPPELPGVNSLLTLAVSVVVVGALYLGREVLIPVTLAVLLSFLLAPIVSVVRRFVPRVAAVGIVVIAALSLFAALAGLIGLQLASLAEDMPRYETMLNEKFDTVRGAVDTRVALLRAQLGQEPAREAALQPKPRTPAPAGTAQSPLTVRVMPPEPNALTIAREFIGPVVAPFATTALVVVIAIFVLLQKDDLRDRLIRLFGSSDLHRTTVAMNDAGRRLSKYFLAQLAINAGFGVLIGLGLVILGVPSAALWGLIAMLLRFVPYVGIYIAAVPAILLAASIEIGWTPAFFTIGIYIIGELIVSQVIEPLAYGHSTGLSPVSIVVTTIFWAWIWGPVGLILATPLTLCLVVLGRHVKRLEFLDVLLGDRPPLSPVESLYQRILANDPDEAAVQADRLLRERPLSVYYDEVAMRALEMAGVDVARGVLSRERLLIMRTAMRELIETLEDFDDAAPRPERKDDGALAPPANETAVPHAPAVRQEAPATLPPGWTAAAPVLCLGGRSPLDDAAASMLAQLLGKHGLPARDVAHEELSREGLAQLDLTGVGVVCVSYMRATGSTAHLRFLLRRLRARGAAVRILLCLSAGMDEENEAGWAEAASLADQRTGTLRGALAACLEAAMEREERKRVLF